MVLDAYVIEKIKREQEQRDSDRIPLQKDPSPPASERRPRPSEHWSDRDRHAPDRGVVIIDM